MERKSTVFLTVIAVLTLLIAVVGATFAYFTVTITGNETATSTIIKTANIKITYTKGQDLALDSAEPGSSGTLTFSVQNEGDRSLQYYVKWTDVVNTFYTGEHPEELKYSVSVTDGNASSLYTLSNITAPGSDGYININSTDPITIAPGVTHNYSITMNFIDTSSVQNYNQGKTFSAAADVELVGNIYYSTDNVYSGE